MRAYQFLCTFADDEKNFGWLEHLQNLVKILEPFKPLNRLFDNWHTPAPFPEDYLNSLTNIYDEEVLKRGLLEFKRKNPDRHFQNLPQLASMLEKEEPIHDQLSASVVYANNFSELSENGDNSVTGTYRTGNKTTYSSQSFSMSFFRIFRTIEDYVRFMVSACEIMCTEKKQIERIVFAPDHYTGKRVFSHRQAGGWMVFYPSKLNPKDFPSASRVINVKDHGTLIVATDEIFDMDNPAHIDKANQVEIRLAELGLLKPLPEMP